MKYMTKEDGRIAVFDHARLLNENNQENLPPGDVAKCTIIPRRLLSTTVLVWGDVTVPADSVK